MTRIRAKIRAPRKPKARPVSRAARQLALAHHIERMVETGKLADYAAAARALGITRARLTQVMNLLRLSPQIQEQVITGVHRKTERALRPAVREAGWQAQLVHCRTEQQSAEEGALSFTRSDENGGHSSLS